MIGPNGTGKCVVEVMSSQLVFFMYKMGHSSVVGVVEVVPNCSNKK